MIAERRGSVGLGSLLLLVLAVAGIGLAVYRFWAGLGAAANLSQGQPWGFWVGLHALAGGSLAAGGFIVAGLMYIFGGAKYGPLARPAILTALLGHLALICALLVDLGRPWAAWRQFVEWQPGSPLFVVAMCVLFGTAALVLASVPIFLKRCDQAEGRQAWTRVSSWLAILLLVAFAALVTHRQPNWAVWVVALAVLLVLFEVLVGRGLIRHDPRTATLLMVAGVIFATLHQSFLGAAFLLAPRHFSLVWLSPWLAVLFPISAVMGGLAIVTVATAIGGRLAGRQVEPPLLRGMSKALSWTILLYLVARGVDLAVRGVGPQLLCTSGQAVWLWTEVALGLLIPLVLLLALRSRGLPLASLLVVAGLIVNRLGLTLAGDPASHGSYWPRWPEIAISAGIVSGGILAFLVVCRLCPVFQERPAPATEA